MMLLRALSVLSLAVLLAGCVNEDMRDLRGFIEEVKDRPPGRIEPLPEIREVETHTYSSAELRNPFAPEEVADSQESTVNNNGLKPDFNRRKEELEAFSLDTLRMVGTLEQDDAVWGLMKTNDGTIHRVKPGNYMGMNYGKINQVLEDKIELTEIIQDGRGGYIERQATVSLGEQ